MGGFLAAVYFFAALPWLTTAGRMWARSMLETWRFGFDDVATIFTLVRSYVLTCMSCYAAMMVQPWTNNDGILQAHWDGVLRCSDYSRHQDRFQTHRITHFGTDHNIAQGKYSFMSMSLSQ